MCCSLFIVKEGKDTLRLAPGAVCPRAGLPRAAPCCVYAEICTYRSAIGLFVAQVKTSCHHQRQKGNTDPPPDSLTAPFMEEVPGLILTSWALIPPPTHAHTQLTRLQSFHPLNKRENSLITSAHTLCGECWCVCLHCSSAQ